MPELRPEFARLAAPLVEVPDRRVWSLLVTVFGDLAQSEGQHLPSGTVQSLSRLMGVKPEATRVALHRLRKDGWIDSTRIGRHSLYTLTPIGRAESHAATPRIYATSPTEEACHLWVRDPAGIAAFPDVCLVLSPGLALASQASGLSVQLMDGAVPDWITSQILSQDQEVALAELHTQLIALNRDLPAIGSISALECAALRVLIVHAWRRQVLKLPHLPDWVFPKGWSGPAARASVMALLDTLPRPSLEDLNSSA